MAEARRHARIARPCCVPAGLGLVLAERGISMEEPLARANLSIDILRAPRTWLSIDQYFALWEAIESAANDPALGLRIGAQYPEHVLEPAFLACLGSRDLGEALTRLARYKCTLCPETLTITRRSDRVTVSYDWPTADRAPPAILVDAELSFLLHLARKGTRRTLRDAEVRLTRKTGDLSEYASVLNAEVRLRARIGTLTFAASDLALAIPTFNPALLAVLEPALEAEYSKSWSASSDAVSAVRRVLRRRLGEGDMSLPEVARELGMSARNLQRQLSGASTSFAALLRDTRRDRATFYLRQSELTLSEISFLLGFDTPTSFFRAFARWTGQTPNAYREREARVDQR